MIVYDPEYGWVVGGDDPESESVAAPTIPDPKPDISDWRAWAHNRAGDCPCGIIREMCDYHR